MRPTAIVLLTALLGMLPGGAFAADAQPKPAAPPPGSRQLEIDQYLTGRGLDRTGSFPGQLTCIATHHSFAPTTAEACGDGMVYVLTMTDGVAIPIKAGTHRVRDMMRDLREQQVAVRGRYSTQTGVITASGVESARTAGDAPKPR
jgi:hypothetical protein